MEFKMLSRSGFYIFLSIISPVIFATIAFFMFRIGQRPGSLLDAALGAGLMGMWSTTLFGSGSAVQRQRYQGTLELLVMAPRSFFWVLLPMTLATSGIGLYSIFATLLITV